MTDFDVFVTKYGPPENADMPRPELLAEYKDRVPAELIELWQRFGFSSYANGLIWVINPKQLEDVMLEWCPAKAKKARAIPVIRTAFGKVIYWTGSTFMLVDIHFNDRFDLGGNVEILFTFFLIGPKAGPAFLQEPTFKKALKRLGPLQADEVYGYKLPLAMGGDYNVANMEKMKIREHLSFLAQVHGIR